MNDSFTPILTYIGTWAATIGGVKLLFSSIEESLTKKAKSNLADWLENLKTPNTIIALPTNFKMMLQRLFGDDYFTLKAFKVSSLFSLIAVFLISAIYFSINPYSIKKFTNIWGAFGYIIFYGLLINIIADFISLCQTRKIIGLMEGHRFLGIGVLFLVDIIVTYVVFVLFVFIGFSLGYFFAIIEYNIYNWLGHPIENKVENFTTFYNYIKIALSGTIPKAFSFKHQQFLLPVFLYTTFTTTIWMFLYSISCQFLILSQKVDRIWKIINRFFSIRKKPVGSIGTIAVIILTIFFLVGAIIIF